jgi:hypothetical protein
MTPRHAADEFRRRRDGLDWNELSSVLERSTLLGCQAKRQIAASRRVAEKR